jgi:GTP cyclohydrolase I
VRNNGESTLAKLDRAKIERATQLLLEGLGQDPKDPDYKDTPRRVFRLWKELLTPKRVNYTSFRKHEAYGNMVILRGHQVIGVCPHHLLPVDMRIYVGYIPDKEVLGLSKLARVAEEQLTDPITQEALTERVAARLRETIEPKGVAVIISGRHGCMRYRGVKTDADIVTSAMHGVFLTNPPAREEFMRIVYGRHHE